MTILNNKVNNKALPLKKGHGNFLLTGSAALPFRASKDIDILCFREDLDEDYTDWRFSTDEQSAVGEDFDIKFVDNHDCLEQMIHLFGDKHLKTDYMALLLLKMGHIHIQRKGKQWTSDISDFHTLLEINNSIQENCYLTLKQVLENHQGLLEGLVSMNNINHHVHTQNVNTTVDKFFDNAVTEHIKHDTLHELLAHEDVPIYTKCQIDPTKVKCHEDLFNSLSDSHKVKMVLEETYTIAAERFIIPDFKMSPHKYEGNSEISKRYIIRALSMVCTNLSSGWFRNYCINHYYSIYNQMDMRYFSDRFHNKIKPILELQRG